MQQAATEVAKKRAVAKKVREEAALLASIHKQMADAKDAAAAKAVAAKAEAEAAKRANLEAQEFKRRAAKEQQQKDEELMRETIRWGGRRGSSSWLLSACIPAASLLCLGGEDS